MEQFNTSPAGGPAEGGRRRVTVDNPLTLTTLSEGSTGSCRAAPDPPCIHVDPEVLLDLLRETGARTSVEVYAELAQRGLVPSTSKVHFGRMCNVLKRLYDARKILRVGPKGQFRYGVAESPPTLEGVVMCSVCSIRPAKVKRGGAPAKKTPLCALCAHKKKEDESLGGCYE